MAACAFDGHMRAGEWKPRLEMVEMGRALLGKGWVGDEDQRQGKDAAEPSLPLHFVPSRPSRLAVKLRL
jgi:hypothetical protein